jgi:hypothetical protein
MLQQRMLRLHLACARRPGSPLLAILQRALREFPEVRPCASCLRVEGRRTLKLLPLFDLSSNSLQTLF